MVHFFCSIPGRRIRNQADAKYSHAHVTRYYYFWSSRHTNGIGSRGTQKFQFRACLIARPGYLNIHAFMQCNLRISSGYRTRELTQFSIVSFCQSWKAFPKSFIIWSNQRIHSCKAQKVDMIANEHKVAWTVRRIETTSSIRNDQRLRAKYAHDTHRECQRLQRIAL